MSKRVNISINDRALKKIDDFLQYSDEFRDFGRSRFLVFCALNYIWWEDRDRFGIDNISPADYIV